jgi:hypothetical protein
VEKSSIYHTFKSGDKNSTFFLFGKSSTGVLTDEGVDVKRRRRFQKNRLLQKIPHPVRTTVHAQYIVDKLFGTRAVARHCAAIEMRT